MTSAKNIRLLGAACALVLPLLACPKSTPETTVATIPVGDARCPNGGIEVTTGKTKQDICNESPELTETQLPVGDAHCPNGGTELQTGYAEGDGGIDVTSTQYVCTNDGTDVGSFAPPAGPAGAFKLNASGGNSSSGPGGPGGAFIAGLEYGSNGGHVKLFGTGAATATVALPSPLPTPNLGTVAWKPTANVEVTFQTSTTPSGLSAGAVFTTGDGNLYVWSGTAADIATGVSIPSGVTVTFDMGSGNTDVSFALTGDFVNAGTITTAFQGDGISRGTLQINTATFEGLPGSSFNLDGAAGTGGGNGGAAGSLGIQCSISLNGGILINASAINASGGAGAVGGPGGSVVLEGYGGVVNTGDITNSGGVSQSGTGAPGSTVEIAAQFGAIENSGNIVGLGTDGNPAGGTGASVIMQIAEGGGIVNTGQLTIHGGSATAACSAGCEGGPAGVVEMVALGGNLTNTGDITAYGGEGGAGDGAPGGEFIVTEGPVGMGGDGIGTGTIQVSGNIDIHGGGGATGGAPGGEIQAVSSVAEKSPTGQELIFLGYGQGVQLNGGNGTEGAPGGHMELINSVGMIGGVPVVGGSVINTANISMTGGLGSTTEGGPGGEIEFQTQSTDFFSDPIEMVINTGNVTLTGGSGVTTGGSMGGLEVECRNGFINAGNWTFDGGAATGMNGTAGSGNMVEVQASQGPISNAGNFSANGGAATASGGTGGSSGAWIFVGNTFANSGNFTANGGNGALAGGGGAIIQAAATTGSATNTGTISTKGGTGTTPGMNGVFLLDGVAISD